MAKYYGTLKGTGDTIVTKTGTESSGIRASAQSYDGSVIVEMFKGKVSISISDTSDTFGDRYFFGTIEELKNALKKS